MRVEIITIGDEILQGQIVDTNSAWIAQTLLEVHAQIVEIISIADRREAILGALNSVRPDVELVIVTGGLGPTRDDVTKQTAAEFFGTQLVRNQDVLDHVRSIFARLQRVMPLSNETQADVFQNGEVLFNEFGTAPGLANDKHGKHFVFLPGVPFEMKHLVQKYIVPYVISKANEQRVLNQYVITAGLGESHLAEQIRDIEDRLPAHIKLAYLPKLGIVRLRLTGVGDDEVMLRNEISKFSTEISDRIVDHLVSNENLEFEEIIVRTLEKRKLTIGTAESCTGGNLARKIVEIPGSSACFMGSVVSYSNDVKRNILGVSSENLERYGAVSEEVVSQMAEGALKVLNTDFAIATSGIAGPGGGTIEKPVGLVWIAVASKNGITAKRFEFRNDRLTNIERATYQGFLMLWNEMKKMIGKYNSNL